MILKHKERLSYDCIGIRAADENNGEYHLSVLNNKFYKLPTNTKVDIKKYIKIKDSKVENRNFTISELGNILKEMYSNAENKMQVASIHIFGIKYGKNIIQKAFKSLDIVKAAGINESYSTELQKALNIYRCLEQNSYGIYISDENAIKEEKEVLGERKTGAENILFYTPPTNEYSIRSRCHFFVDVENISSAVAVNINCNAYVAINEDKTEIFDLSTTKRIKVLSDEKIRIEFMFPGDFQEKIYNSLREMNSIKRPHIFITAIYSNTTGGHFYIKNGYHIYVDEYEKIKCWHSIVASAEVEYKSELNYLRRTGKKNQLFERIKKQVEESAGDEKYIEFECVDMMDIFKYGIITEEEYLKKLKECHYPTYVGNLNAGCINKEQSSEEKRSNC